MAEESTARVDLRHHTLAEGATLVPGDGPNGAEGFIALPEPPPVGSVVHLQPGARALAVTQVAESADGDTGTGIYVREATAGDLERHGRIGTERMGPSNLDPSAGDDESDNMLSEDAAPAKIGTPAPPAQDEGGAAQAEAASAAPESAQAEVEATPTAVAEGEPESATTDEGGETHGDGDGDGDGDGEKKDSGRGGKKRKGRRRS